MFFVGIFNVTDKRAGFGSVTQRWYASAHPDQNVTDPEHWSVLDTVVTVQRLLGRQAFTRFESGLSVPEIILNLS